MTVLIMADTDLVSDGGALNGAIGRLQRELFLEAENECAEKSSGLMTFFARVL
jgi:hypothetical protein